jgi:hypothetical protein
VKHHFTFEKKYSPNENVAMDHIFDILLDKYPSLHSENETSWMFELGKPTVLDWYVDKELPDNIGRVLDLKLEDLPGFYEYSAIEDVETVISMFHSYALVAGSHFMKKYPEKHITSIIHIDDHTDMMPALTKEGEGEVNLSQPDEILEKINYGTIGMGNFLTNFILHSKPGQIYHVKNDGQSSEVASFDKWELAVSCHNVNLGGHTFKKTEVYPNMKVGEENASCWTYQLCNKFPATLPLGSSESVWLDIDLDFFSNRYNKDSDWEKLSSYNPSLREVKQSLIQMKKDIMNASWIQQLAVLTVSYSPGFFPSEYFEIAKDLLVDPLIEFITLQLRGECNE